ncbi:MAG TPA: transcriptional activator NhaR [Planctomycetota bacterium]|nr:transcriptional activator NhaR [Planctomycetota bacterium]
MDWLNYHHLLYFWVVAREGSVTRASQQLHLSQPTLSAQIRALETALKVKLFARAGRNLVLTDAGRRVYRYADQIFPLGRELLESVHGSPAGRPVRLIVGITDVIPKMIAYELLKPALSQQGNVQIVCREDKPERLLADLSVHELDVVLTDAPVPPTVKVRAFNHLLGECGIVVFGERKLASRYRRGFPKSLNGAPLLIPGEGTSLRRSLEHWFAASEIKPRVLGEFDDTALMNAFGQAGVGLFVAPAVIQKQVCSQFGVKAVGAIDTIRERYYAVSIERKLTHPAVAAISDSARHTLFKT